MAKIRTNKDKLACKDKLAWLRAALLDWYDRNRRDLPWRRSRDPYAIWVSEVMLQQTRVAAVVEKYQAFLARFPTVVALAMAPEQEVLAQWSGLGYYRRARMLHKAAQLVAGAARGQMPNTAAELRALPGIGGYTAAAIASIAFGERVAVVDGNVERVLCRIAGWDANGAYRRKVEELAAQLVDEERPGDFNQAMMELGATVCLPRNPRCLVCPVSEDCKTRGEHKTAARPRMVSSEVGCGLFLRKAGQVLLEQRPSTVSVMPGLWELPWLRETPNEHIRFTVRHAIMNVNYVVRVCDVRGRDLDGLTVAGGERQWIRLRDAFGMALTGLARKVLKRVVAEEIG